MESNQSSGFAFYNGTEGANLDDGGQEGIQFLPDALLPSASNNSSLTNSPLANPMKAASPEAVIGLSIVFCIIGFIGLLGNFLIIYVILVDRKMRRSATNIFIINLAVADFLIMALGVPEITQFMLNRGWILGTPLCKAFRYILVFSLYVSVLTLVGVCVERYIAIVSPIKAHILCSRRRILVAIGVIWPVALTLALPTVLYNDVRRPSPVFPVELCILALPKKYYMFYKVTECVIFFLGPVLVQIVLYSIISNHLFIGTEALHRKQVSTSTSGTTREKDSDAIKARKGVVKMLIATVLVYFLSYAPVQIPLFYNIASSTAFKQNWSFLVLVMTLGYVNSAANPILYSIFSRNFRLKFAQALCRCCNKSNQANGGYRPASSVALDTYTTNCKTAGGGATYNNRGPHSRFTAAVTHAEVSHC